MTSTFRCTFATWPPRAVSLDSPKLTNIGGKLLRPFRTVTGRCLLNSALLLRLCSYSKNEYLKPGDIELHDFTYILSEATSKHSESSQFLQETHEVVEFVDCFNNIGLQYQSVLPVKIKTKPCLWIMRRKKSSRTSAEMKDRVRQRMLEYKLKQQLENNQTEIIVDTPPAANDFNGAVEEDLLVEIESPERIAQLPDRVETETSQKRSRTRAKLKEMVVSHYRSKGRIVEDSTGSGESALRPNDEESSLVSIPSSSVTPKVSMKLNIKRIIKAEKIREMVERISTVDLQKTCDLERMSTKDCLRKLIDDYDEESD